jgi:hypothetical protein
VLHLRIGKVLEAQEDHQQIGGLQRLEPGNVGAAGFDEAGLRIRGEEHTAPEAVVLREDPRQRGQRLLGAILVVTGEKDDVLAASGTCRTLVDDEVWILRRGGSGQQTDERQPQQRFQHMSRLERP